MEGEGDALAETAALEDAEERLVLDALGLVLLDGSEKVVAGVEKPVVVSVEVDKITLFVEEVVVVDETVASVELVPSLSVEDMDIGIVAVVDGRGFKVVEKVGSDTVVDVVTPSLVEMGSMVIVCAATRAMGTSNASASFMMVDR